MEKRCVYAYEFSDKYVYVGLTNDLKRRKNQHNCDKNSYVYKHKNNNIVKLEIKQLTEYINEEISQIKEAEFIENYRNSGWNILNVAKPGGLGCGSVKWLHDECIKASLLCDSRIEFHLKFCGAYYSAKNNNWLNEIYSILEDKRIKLYWTYDKCMEIALKYRTKKEFYTSDKNVYNACRRNNWLNCICSHMKSSKKPNGYYTYDKCKEIALKYKTKKDFLLNENFIYQKCKANNWLNDICYNMIQNIHWDYDKCKKLAETCKSRTEFNIKSQSAYYKSKINKWLDEFFPK